jgi:hypothetical protein
VTDVRPAPNTAWLGALLGSQVRRVRGRFLLHGISLCVLLPALAIGVAFLLDHTLRLPLPIRLLHTAATIALLGFIAWRHVRYPLTRRFRDVDTALVLERVFPDLHQRLVSAVQLQTVADGELRNQSRAMIDRLLAEASEAVQALPLQRLFDDRRTAGFGAAGALASALLVAGAVFAPDTARAFVLRHLGAAADYPRATHLVLELPPAGADLQRTDSDGASDLVLPAGADLHVSVLAEGVVPKEVFLDVAPLAADQGSSSAARSVAMAVRPGNRFRHVFRRLSGAFEFHARGGDDERGDRVVRVRTVHPPQVASIQALIRPPAYTGVPQQQQNGGAIEALVGSAVELSVATTTAVRQATLAFLESGQRLDLVPTSIQDDSGTATVYRGQFTVERSDRYQIDLVGDGGLRNPSPGTYPIAAQQDYAPVGRWLLPDDETALLLPEALLCVRVHVHDDFGLAQVEFAVERAGQRTLQRVLLPAADPAAATATPGDAPPPPPAPPRVSAILTELVEVRDLLQGATVANDGLSLAVSLRDARRPEPGTTELPRRLVQIVDAPQLAAAIGRLFRGLREETEQALEIQVDRRTRLDELVARDVGSTEFTQTLTGIEVGQGRVVTAAERVHRGLMRAFDLHLWNRLEPSQHAAKVVDLYRTASDTLSEPVSLSAPFYRDLLARRAAGTLGGMETTLDPILQMIALADRLAVTDGPEAGRLLAEAQVARAGSERSALLQRTLAAQQRMQDTLRDLLQRLEEWNDYQDLVQEARALRDRQRDLQTRTEEARGSK